MRFSSTFASSFAAVFFAFFFGFAVVSAVSRSGESPFSASKILGCL
jgi:hypothetical protein